MAANQADEFHAVFYPGAAVRAAAGVRASLTLDATRRICPMKTNFCRIDFINDNDYHSPLLTVAIPVQPC
jgi:hypothetical protein